MKPLNRIKLLTWLSDHSRAYYSSFYFVTAVAWLFAAIGFLFAPAAVTSVWPGQFAWATAYFLESFVFVYLGVTAKKEPSGTSARIRIKQIAIGGTVALLIGRGILGVLIGVGGPILALVTPIWVSFVMLWAGPIIWYLPAEVDEYEKLRARVDSIHEEVEEVKRGNGTS